MNIKIIDVYINRIADKGEGELYGEAEITVDKHPVKFNFRDETMFSLGSIHVTKIKYAPAVKNKEKLYKILDKYANSVVFRRTITKQFENQYL